MDRPPPSGPRGAPPAGARRGGGGGGGWDRDRGEERYGGRADPYHSRQKRSRSRTPETRTHRGSGRERGGGGGERERDYNTRSSHGHGANGRRSRSPDREHRGNGARRGGREHEPPAADKLRERDHPGRDDKIRQYRNRSSDRHAGDRRRGRSRSAGRHKSKSRERERRHDGHTARSKSRDRSGRPKRDDGVAPIGPRAEIRKADSPAVPQLDDSTPIQDTPMTEPAAETGDAEIEGEDDMEAQMQAMMGFGGFSTTKQKKVKGNDVSGVHKDKQTSYRQYMNRPGGFNRALSPS